MYSKPGEKMSNNESQASPAEPENTGENKATLKASNVMVKKVIAVDEKVLVREAANIMDQFEIGSVIVTRNRKPIGIITERDLLKRIVSEGRDAKKTMAREIMSSPLVSISPSTDLEAAACLMFERKIKKLPITENERLVGLLSLTDIARVQPMMKFMQKLAETQHPPRSMQKVINSYIV